MYSTTSILKQQIWLFGKIKGSRRQLLTPEFYRLNDRNNTHSYSGSQNHHDFIFGTTSLNVWMFEHDYHPNELDLRIFFLYISVNPVLTHFAFW